jgi:hypothetical protein
MGPAKLVPALAGGAFLGVMSALPFIQAGNCCCCLWLVGGGMLAAYVMQQNHPRAITPGDGAIAGWLAGVFGAVAWLVVSVPLQATTGPLQARWIERFMERAGEIPAELRGPLEQMREADISLAGVLVSFLVVLVLGMIFSTLGGLLGALFFRREAVLPPGTIDVLPPER